jgi:hypothetical protein
MGWPKPPQTPWPATSIWHLGGLVTPHKAKDFFKIKKKKKKVLAP